MRLNRLNLRRIEEIITSIKFKETWTLNEQIEKTKIVFGNMGSKYLDEELLTLYMMIRNELKIKDIKNHLGLTSYINIEECFCTEEL